MLSIIRIGGHSRNRRVIVTMKSAIIFCSIVSLARCDDGYSYSPYSGSPYYYSGGSPYYYSGYDPSAGSYYSSSYYSWWDDDFDPNKAIWDEDDFTDCPCEPWRGDDGSRYTNVGNAACDPSCNVPECDWDGGDCCMNSCFDDPADRLSISPQACEPCTWATCGNYQYDCKDPDYIVPSAAPTNVPTPAPTPIETVTASTEDELATHLQSSSGAVVRILITADITLSESHEITGGKYLIKGDSDADRRRLADDQPRRTLTMSGDHRFFTLDSFVEVELESLTLRGGRGDSGGFAYGREDSKLTVTDCHFEDFSAEVRCRCCLLLCCALVVA